MIVKRIRNEGVSAMRGCTLVLPAIVAAVSACAHTTAISPSDVETCGALTQKAARGETIIVLRNGAELEGSGLLFAPDSTSWLDPSTSEARKVATSKIAAVRLTNPGVGALKGLGTGLLLGAGIGLALNPPGGDGFRPPTAKSTAFCGAVGGLIGACVGSASGGTESYYLQSAPRATVEAP